MTSLRIIAVLCLILTITLCSCEGKNIPVDESSLEFKFSADKDDIVPPSPKEKDRNFLQRLYDDFDGTMLRDMYKIFDNLTSTDRRYIEKCDRENEQMWKDINDFFSPFIKFVKNIF